MAEPTPGLLENPPLPTLDQAVGPARVHANSVAVQRAAQLVPRAAMPVPAEGLRLIDDLVAGSQDPDENLVVATRASRRSPVELGSEGAQLIEDRPSKGHACACSHRPDGQRILSGLGEDSPPEAASHRAATLEPLLRLRLQLERH